MEDQVLAARRYLEGHPRAAIHLMGLAGFGMAGLAQLLQQRGFSVSGCDVQSNRLTERLTRNGLLCLTGHDPAHIHRDLLMLIRSTAVPDQHPEVATARAMGIPVFRRGEVLPALLHGRTSVAVSGTHGKTTTTAMTVHALRAAGHMPSYFIGGEWEEQGQVAGCDNPSLLVVEADESDGTLKGYSPDIGIMTGIDFDHMEHFADEQSFVESFLIFARRVKRRVVWCAEDHRLQRLLHTLPHGLSYGFGEQADLRAEQIMEHSGGSACTLLFQGQPVGRLKLPIPGRHNILNAMAALLVTKELDLFTSSLCEAMQDFKPVGRRFQRVGRVGGADVILDYAHHPTEIRALISAAHHLPHQRMLAVFQPHRYSRTRALGAAFPAAFRGVDHLWLCPVYAASEQPLEGGHLEDLIQHFGADGTVPVCAASSVRDAWREIRQALRPGDILLIIGAGDVEQMAGWTMGK